ncbi:MAG: DNA topoisomerase VI [Thermoprotei archaeon]|nr:MAG: DNA topoisomerase VI [Thermoprotei archaeon]
MPRIPAPSDKEVISRLERLATKILNMIEKSAPPYLEIPVRSLSNTIWDEEKKILRLGPQRATREFFDLKESKKFMQTLLMLSLIVKARRENDYPTIRDLYYMGKHTIVYKDHLGRRCTEETWYDQRESNSVIQDIEVATGLLREHMGVMHDAKGKIVGNIVVRSKGYLIDCSRMGSGAYAIPPNPDRLEIAKVEADYVLCVEKDAIFERLNEEEFWRRENCILVTGKGQPDRSTRRMIRRLWEEFGLPVYILTDCDSYGFYIYSVYRSGSISLSYESERLATPGAKFIGVTVSDIEEYKIPKNYIIAATDRDLKRAQELLNYPWFKSEKWQRELKLFLRKKQKIEIEALSGHGFKFLSHVYLPEKISKKKWIE